MQQPGMQAQPQVIAQTTTVGQPGAPNTIIVQQPHPTRTGPRIYENYQANQSQWLGIIQVLIGLFCILFNSIGIGIGASASDGGTGIWTGLFFMLTGAFGIGAARSKTACPIITFMTLAIIAAVFCIPLLSAASVGLGTDNNCRDYYDYYYNTRYNRCTYDSKHSAKIAMNGLLVGLALLEAIVSIWSSAICCAAVCCCARSPQQGMVLGTPGQTMVITTTTTQGYPAQQQPGGQMQYMYQQPQYPPQQQPLVGGQPNYMAQPGQTPVGMQQAPFMAPPPYSEVGQTSSPPQPGMAAQGTVPSEAKTEAYNPDYKPPI